MSKQFKDVVSSATATVRGLGVSDVTNVLSIEGQGYVDIRNLSDDCLGKPELCDEGLSVSFWVKHGGKDKGG